MHTWRKVGCCLVAGVALSASAVSLQVNQVKQRYPWNGLVDIDYTIAWEDGEGPDLDDNLEVLMVDKSVSPAVTNKANCFLQVPLPMTNGSHRITWNANYDGVKVRSNHAEFIVKIAHYGAAYMVIDVSTGSKSNAIYKVDFLNGAPLGDFTTDEYKGDKIVLRRIRPGSYIAGSPTNEVGRRDEREAQHPVAIAKPFYIGVFEVTQKQYANVMGNTAYSYLGDFRPVDKVSYETVRGGNWPADAKPASGSFMDVLNKRCRTNDGNGVYNNKIEGFDLPCEFQWEFACRAGTTQAFNTTNSFDNTDTEDHVRQLKLLGRFSGNTSDKAGGDYSAHTIVGQYEPNAWGLYDMHGNVFEFCNDWYQADAASLKQYVDPQGPERKNEHVQKSGSWRYSVDFCRSAFRSYSLPESEGTGDYGFRLFWSAPQ